MSANQKTKNPRFKTRKSKLIRNVVIIAVAVALYCAAFPMYYTTNSLIRAVEKGCQIDEITRVWDGKTDYNKYIVGRADSAKHNGEIEEYLVMTTANNMGYPFGYGNPWTKLYKNDESMKIKVFNDEVQAVLIDNHYEQEVFAEGESWENGDVPQLTYAELICVMCGFVNDERIETVMVLTNQGAMYSADVSKETGAFALMYTSGRIIRTITEEVLLMYEGYINAPYTLVQGYDKDGNLIDTFDVRDIDDPYITEIYNPHVAEWFPKSDIPGANQGFKSLGWADLETGEITYYEEEE